MWLIQSQESHRDSAALPAETLCVLVSISQEWAENAFKAHS